MKIRAGKHLPQWLLLLALAVTFTGAQLVQEGMFSDGTAYAVISRNFATHTGTFWQPHFTQTLQGTGTIWSVYNSDQLGKAFYEQPPLMFAMEGLIFQLLGNTLWSERLFSLLMLLISAWLIIKIWQETSATEEDKKYSWHPLMNWIITPLVFWSFANNMLENCVSVFTLLSILLLLKSELKKQHVIIMQSSAAFAIVCGVLCKGFPALFPLATIPLIYLIFKPYNLKKAIQNSLYVAFITCSLFAILLLNSQAREFIAQYFDQQVLSSIVGGRRTSSPLWDMPWRLLQELLPAILFSVATLLTAQAILHQRHKPSKKAHKKTRFFFFTGISASFPLMISPHFSGFYLVPAFIWFALALSTITLPAIKQIKATLSTRRHFTIQLIISLSLLTCAITFLYSKTNETARHRILIQDIKSLAPYVSHNKTIGISPELWTLWPLHINMARYYNISLIPASDTCQTLIVPQGQDNSNNNFKKIATPALTIDLYKKTRPSLSRVKKNEKSTTLYSYGMQIQESL